MRIKIIAFPDFKVDCEFSNCVLYVLHLTTPICDFVRSRSRFLNSRRVLSLMSYEALNLLKLQRCYSQLQICLSYLPFEPFSGTRQLPAIVVSTDWFTSLVMLADSSASS